jgi:propionate CoA-transferase
MGFSTRGAERGRGGGWAVVQLVKFVKRVKEKTFAAATAGGRPILYVTERCVFSLTPTGLELIEVAPGVDVERDVMQWMAFRPALPVGGPTLMDARIFADV